MQHEVNVIENVVKCIGESIHRVGHSFGGAVALAALIGRFQVLSIAAFEANPLMFIENCNHPEIIELVN